MPGSNSFFPLKLVFLYYQNILVLLDEKVKRGSDIITWYLLNGSALMKDMVFIPEMFAIDFVCMLAHCVTILRRAVISDYGFVGHHT